MNEEEKAIIQKLLVKGPDLLDTLELTEKLMRCLESSGTVTKTNKSQIMAMKYDDQEKIGNLLDHVKRDPIKRYEALISALRKTQQYRVLDLLGEPRFEKGADQLEEEELMETSADVSVRGLAEKLMENISCSTSTLKKLDFDLLSTYLTDYKVITEDQWDYVEAKATPLDKAKELFKVRLPTRSKKCYLRFGRALIDSNQDHFLDDLEVTEEEKRFLKTFNVKD